MRAIGMGGVLLGVLAITAPAFAQAHDISGRWEVVFTTPQGAMPSSPLELRREGDKFVGVLHTQQGRADVEATLQDAVVTFHLPPFQTPNGPVQLTMSGTVDGETMKGTMGTAAGFQMDWSARRTERPQAPSSQVDLSGTWGLEVVTPAGTGTPTIVLKQDGEKLTGQYTGQLGEAPITGTIRGNEFTFSFSVTVEGNTGTVIYRGTAEGETMKGTVTLGEMGEGTFTGKKK